MITLYTKPACPYCVTAKAWLDRHGFPYRTVDIAEDAAAKAFVLAEGHTTVPQIYWADRLLVAGGAAGLTALTPEALAMRIATLARVPEVS